MRLTPQMWNEIKRINARVINLHREAFDPNDPASFDRVRACNFEEINAYKIKLEFFSLKLISDRLTGATNPLFY